MATSLKSDSTEADQTDVCRDLSPHLYRVLDAVGVSEQVREGHRQQATIGEILDTAKVNRGGPLSWYIFGSQFEGSTLLSLNSDMDRLCCDELIPVVENVDEAPADGQALLMISDETKPGYVKLQSVFNRTKQTLGQKEGIPEDYKDHLDRVLLRHIHNQIPNSERHGPAENIPAREGASERDYVRAYRCRVIPSFADEWLLRPRPYQWPSQERLQRMGSYGCFLVGVGHPMSRNKVKVGEWRISFSLQERELMSSLNPTQHKCYVLPKMIKKDIIQPRIGQSLSSYHCKTCIFHLAERRGVEQWTPNNIVSCILQCLRLLLDWIIQENCPNYFIREENMFDKLDKSTLARLSLVLQEMLLNGVEFLYEIKCENFGTLLLKLGVSAEIIEKKELEVKKEYGFYFHMSMMLILLTAKIRIYRYIYDASSHSERLSRANRTLQYLENTTVITEHNPEDVRRALYRLLPYIHFIIAQIRYSNELHQMYENVDDEVIQALAQEVKHFEECDLISPRLLVASLYLQCDKLDGCQELLDHCDTDLNLYVNSLCQCHIYQRHRNKLTKEKIVAEKPSYEEFRKECTAACMTFLPSEANLVPSALRYEMYRSVHTPQGSRHKVEDFWFDWIVVDSKVYLYFLQYVLYVQTNNPTKKQHAIENILLLLMTDPNLGHRETALNLMGWIYTKENENQDAFECFRRSLAIRPFHNAAKWHIAILLNSLINTQTIYDRKWFQ